MNNLQEKLIEMLVWFNGICERYNLQYYALGGTALGAVRHNGFIPWDDDIDVGMYRNDYEKLKSLKEEINQDEIYFIEFPCDNRDYVYPYCKIYDKRTTLIENTRLKAQRGIFMDVFPLDYIGDTKEESLKKFIKIDSKTNILFALVCEVNNSRKWYKNLMIRLLHVIPQPILNHTKVLKSIEKCRQKLIPQNGEYISNLFGNWHEKEISKKEWFGIPQAHPFESTTVYIPENYDEYLKSLYGDYMTPPPVEKQKSHHDYVELDLNKPFII